MAGPRTPLTVALLVAAAASLAGCERQPAAPEAAAATVDLAAALAGRGAEDRARDAGRKPAEVLAFVGVEPGMTVLDLFAAGGWYTEVLALAVGPEGRVYAHNNRFLLEMRDGANDLAMAARLADGRLPNVERLDRELDDLGLAPGSVDVVMFSLNFHDVYNGGGPEAALALLNRLHVLLKPGGVVGLIDHHGAAGQDNAQLHRIEKEKVLETVRASDLVLDAESGLLHNHADDLAEGVFAPAVRGNTHRFLLRLKKPATS